MNSSLRILACVLLVQVLAPLAVAHPGHGTPGPTHYLTSFNHAVTVGLFLLAAAAIWVTTHRVSRRRTKA